MKRTTTESKRSDSQLHGRLRTSRMIEESALELRRKAGAGPDEPIDVSTCAGRLHAAITVLDTSHLPVEDKAKLDAMSAKVWSGAAKKMPNGQLQIMLNPNQTLERMNVTVFEEIAHDYLNHVPSALNETGVPGRSYDRQQEDEAYWVAAATLLPSRVVAQAVWKGTPGAVVAARYGVSVELFEFRVKRLNLWSRYAVRISAA